MPGRKVLIVDDHELTKKMISAFFLSRGIKVEMAESGTEALEILKNMKIDAIILDLMMPGMDGFEFCEWVKKDDLLKDTPIIILSAFPTNENIKRILLLGACDFIRKPFNVRELTEKVVSIMG